MDMSALVFPAILLGVLLIFFAVFMIINKRQHQRSSINESKSTTNTSNKKENKKENSKNVSDAPREDVFNFMEFDRILDSMIVQNDGTKFTMAVKCKGINYDLMSDMEQIAVEEGFITFLNTLRYPIQLYIQAQNIDLKSAIATYRQNASGIEQEYEDINREYTELLEQFDAKESDIKAVEEKRDRVLNVYEYASDIINYVEKLSLNKSLLQRNFYVLVSYYSSEITASSNFSKDEIVNICYNELLTRAQSIISGLATCSVTGVVLDSNELADLLYTAYNRDDKGLVSVREAIQSGFYRLYSTSEDVLYKKQEKLVEQINQEAELKAYEAIKKAMEEGKYVSPSAEKLDIIDQVSKTAAEIVKKEDIPQDIKDKAKEILVEDYVVNKNKIIEEEKEDRDRKLGKKSSAKSKNDDELSNNEKTNEVSKDDSKSKVSNNSTIEEQTLDNRMGFEVPVEEKVNKKEESSSNDEDDDLII